MLYFNTAAVTGDNPAACPLTLAVKNFDVTEKHGQGVGL